MVTLAKDLCVSTKKEESPKDWWEGGGISCRRRLQIQTPGSVSLISLNFLSPSMRGKPIYKGALFSWREVCFFDFLRTLQGGFGDDDLSRTIFLLMLLMP